MSKFAKSFMKSLKDDTSSIAGEAKSAAEFSGYVDTGSYTLNAVFSGSIYGGMPDNKIMTFAGDPATGKTFFALGICKSFLDSNEESVVLYYDSEAAVTKKMMTDRDIDADRVIIGEPECLEDFRHKAVTALDKYKEAGPESPRLMIVLDSLGNLPSRKELEDAAEGKEVVDMTKPKIIRGIFRILTLKAARANVPIIFNNHTYESPSMYEAKKTSGGMGPIYAASTVAMLSKKKEKDGTEVIGNIVHVRMFKSRLSKENTVVDVKITYKHGLDRYYGLLDLAEKYQVIKKVGNKYELADGRKVFGKEINEKPEEVYTKDILDQIDEAAKKEFSYGDQ
jgi:RecA/RadA recombinase